MKKLIITVRDDSILEFIELVFKIEPDLWDCTVVKETAFSPNLIKFYKLIVGFEAVEKSILEKYIERIKSTIEEADNVKFYEYKYEDGKASKGLENAKILISFNESHWVAK